jgi:hypothetical protein
MDGDPRPEREAVPEARVDRVLEVGVRVDEAGEDDRLLEPLALADLGHRPHPGDEPVVADRHGAVRDREAFDRDDPVG